MVKAVAFDLGKVLLDFDYAIAARKIAAQGKILADDLTHFINHNPLIYRYESGLVTSEQFHREVCALTGFAGGLQEFGEIFSNIFAPIEPMIQLQAALRARGIPTFIFSNTNDLVVQHVRRTFPFFANFDGYILSYEHHAMKPDAKLYEAVENESGGHGAEILYLDDRPENVAAGAARGWQAFLHENPEKSRAIVEKLGLLNHQ
jgi:HAD superfamily hydrolase (TIGR01509 family)